MQNRQSAKIRAISTTALFFPRSKINVAAPLWIISCQPYQCRGCAEATSILHNMSTSSITLLRPPFLLLLIKTARLLWPLSPLANRKHKWLTKRPERWKFPLQKARLMEHTHLPSSSLLLASGFRSMILLSRDYRGCETILLLQLRSDFRPKTHSLLHGNTLGKYLISLPRLYIKKFQQVFSPTAVTDDIFSSQHVCTAKM